MKIFEFLICVSIFLNTYAYTPICHKKLGLQLYMKKTKNYNKPFYIPKTINQDKYVKCLDNDNTKIVIAIGPAGCGKTLFACQKAISEFKSENIHKIIITRPVVSVDEEIGYLPGSINQKMDPWTKPIFDIFLDFFSKSELDIMLINGKIEICPLAFMRGRTFKYSFIIADEMQNSSPSQMKMLTTRLGNNCRMIITGDLQQTDIIKENGLHNFVNKFKEFNQTSELIHIIQLNNDDIERSNIVKKVIEIYDYDNDTIIQNESKYINYNNDAALIPIQHLTIYPNIFNNK
jgi:phosphate starvation-inducible PhoH-like protein